MSILQVIHFVTYVTSNYMRLKTYFKNLILVFEKTLLYEEKCYECNE